MSLNTDYAVDATITNANNIGCDNFCKTIDGFVCPEVTIFDGG